MNKARLEDYVKTSLPFIRPGFLSSEHGNNKSERSSVALLKPAEGEMLLEVWLEVFRRRQAVVKKVSKNSPLWLENGTDSDVR